MAWSLFDPARLDDWWDAKTRRVTPDGLLSPGQRIECRAGPIGMFAATVEVPEVDPAAHRLRRVARLPFGVVNDQTTTLAPLGPSRCPISFG